MTKTFIVAYIDWYTHELVLERIHAASWQTAAALHSKYPWRNEAQGDPLTFTSSDAFKQECFDCDCMMNWIEI